MEETAVEVLDIARPTRASPFAEEIRAGPRGSSGRAVGLLGGGVAG